MIHYLEIIGEAAGRISPGTLSNHSEIPWNKIIGMRHILVHGYFDIDLDIVWSVLQNDLNPLKDQLIVLASEVS